jgi:hypothetical protein
VVKQDMLLKTRQRINQYFGSQARIGHLSVMALVRTWTMVIRPLLEYGAELWGDEQWDDAEQLQLDVAKRILRCSRYTTNEAVLGELGWWSLKARRDELRLRYWIRLQMMKADRLPRLLCEHVNDELQQQQQQQQHNDMEEKKERYELRERQQHAVNDEKLRRKRSRPWIEYTRQLLSQFDVGVVADMQQHINHDDVKHDEEGGEEKKDPYEYCTDVIREHIRQREEKEWKARMLQQPKLVLYCQLKDELVCEGYLLYTMNDLVGRTMMARLRMGTHALRVETGRYVNETREQRVCRMCELGVVEDEIHFMLDCPVYHGLRMRMWSAISTVVGGWVAKKQEESSVSQMKFLLGGNHNNNKINNDKQRQCHKYVMKYIVMAFAERQRRLGERS